MSSDYDQRTLGWWMDERRGELGLTWNEVATRAGSSTETLYRIAKNRNSRPMRTTTRKGIERALMWEHGSIDTILNGGEPTSRSDNDDQAELSFDERLDELEAALRDARRQNQESIAREEKLLEELRGMRGRRRAG